jgi:hypothetical protein
MVDIAWGKKVSPAFKAKLIDIAAELGCDPNHLMAAMAFETGETFSPSVKNPGSSATGLIQFMRKTAEGLDTTVEPLALMTAEDQLDFVRKYLQPFKGRMKTLSDVYMTILLPAAVGKPETHVLFQRPSDQYERNKGLDADRDGAVTKSEAAAKVQNKLAKGLDAANLG